MKFKIIVLVFLLFVFVIITNVFADNSQNILQYWNFDKDDSTITSTGNMPAKATPECKWVEGIIGKAVRFNGIDSKIILQGQHDILFEKNDSFTIDFWIMVFKQGETQQIFSSTPLMEIEVRGENGTISFNLKGIDGSKESVRCTGQTDIVDGKWHHIAAIRDSKKKKLFLIIDGSKDTEVVDKTTGSRVMIGKNSIIGGRSDNKEMLDGIVDELRITKGIQKIEHVFNKTQKRQTTKHVLENELISMTFSEISNTVYLHSFIDKKHNLEFIENSLPLTELKNLWQANLKSENKTTILNENSGKLSIINCNVQTGKEIIFSWKGIVIDNEEETVDVKMTVALHNGSPMSEWKISVKNNSKRYGAWIVKYPLISNFKKLSQQGENEFVAIPGGNGGGAGEGQLYQDPFKSLKAKVRTYPCYYQSMQFNAYYGSQGGIYLATHDGESNLKGFLLKTSSKSKPVMQYEVHNYPENSGVAGTSYEQKYPSVVGPFTGNWYDACKIYRSWALKQKWCRLGQTWQRDDIAPSIKKGSYWMMYALEFENSKDKLMRDKARSLPINEVKKRARKIDVNKSIQLLKESYDYFDFPMILWCNSWFEGGGDMSPPRYIPMNNYDKLLERIHKEFPDAKLSAYLAPKRFSIQCLEYNKEVELSLEQNSKGDPAIGPVMLTETNDRHAYPCWATKHWKNYWVIKSKELAELGTDGFHIDELGSSTSFDNQCFNAKHGHPIGGGTLYNDTRRNMVKIIRENARKVNPNFAVHHEVLSEIYIDVADLAEVCTSPSNINIPMYEAVYHDYNFIMGRRIIKWNDRNLWPPSKEKGDENIGEFVASFGQTYIWGNQPGWTRTDIVSYSPKVAAIIKQFMEARYRAMDYLHFGIIMRPLEITQPLPKVETIWRSCDTPKHVMPAVINSVWKAPNENSIAIVLVNISDKPQEISYRYNLKECGLDGKKFDISRIDTKKPEHLGIYQGIILNRTDTITPQSVKIVKIIPAK